MVCACVCLFVCECVLARVRIARHYSHIYFGVSYILKIQYICFNIIYIINEKNYMLSIVK